MVVIRSIVQFVDTMNDWIGRILSFGVLFMFLLMLSEVIRRYFFNAPTVWGNELTQLIFGGYVVLCGGYILRWEGHTNVDILYGSFPPRMKALIDILTSFLFFFFAGVMFITGASLSWESLKTFEHSQSAWNPPLYPLKLLIPTGAFLLLSQGLAKFIRDVMIVLGKDPGMMEENHRKEIE